MRTMPDMKKADAEINGPLVIGRKIMSDKARG
jgi:hypothetical protein